MENDNKKSQLVWDMRITRTILKRNTTESAKYCRYCGKLLADNCGCQQPYEVIDVKPARGTENGTVAVFANTQAFQEVLSEVTEEIKTKDEEKRKAKDTEAEQLRIKFED